MAAGVELRGWNLRILNDEMPRRENKGNQRSGKEHLDDRHIALVTGEDLGERVAVVNTKASRSSHS